MSTRDLPARPDLKQYKKQAKELVKSRAAAMPEALQRIGKYHPRFQKPTGGDIHRTSFKLSDAQLTIAREYDFDTWSQFARHIQTLHPAESNASAEPVSPILTEQIRVGGARLEAHITGAEGGKGLVLFAQASGSHRYHPSNRYLAHQLNRASICTVLADLLTEDEELADFETGNLGIDIGLLGKRTTGITDWLSQDSRFKDLPLGYLASGNGAAAAMFAAGERPGLIRAVVSGGGRPDLAGPWLWMVQAPTLFVVGSRDTVKLGFTQSIMAQLPQSVDRRLAVLEGSQHVFEEPDALEGTATLAVDWLQRYLAL
ncbi:MAG: alpha/beta fold hydrolase [Bryobacteraceae bacterium]